jgi:hypothetical protein
MDTKVAVVCGAVEAQVDGEGDRRPCRVLSAAVKAYLHTSTCEHTTHSWRHSIEGRIDVPHTLLAALVFSFAKMFLDSVLLARAPDAMVGKQV